LPIQCVQHFPSIRLGAAIRSGSSRSQVGIAATDFIFLNMHELRLFAGLMELIII